MHVVRETCGDGFFSVEAGKIMSEGARRVNPKLAQILSEFLAEQEQRLSGKSCSRYRKVVELLKTSLNNYAYQGPCGVDARRFEQLYNAEGEEQRQFCEIFGAEQIIPNLRDFLSYFMVRKVIAGAELMRAAGTVIKSMSKWLAEKAYVGPAGTRNCAQHGAAGPRHPPPAPPAALRPHPFPDPST